MEDVPYGRILREGWLIILIAALLGGAAAYGVAKLLPETYTATSTLLLQVESKEASLFERSQFSLARIKTYPALVDSPDVIDGVRADLDLSVEEYSDRDIRRMLSGENTTDTVLLTVRADAPTAFLAAGMANSAARNLSELIEDTENAANDDRYDVTLDQVIPAVEPVSPSSPQVLAITGLGLIAGFALGAIVAVYRTTTNRRLRTISDVRRAAGLPVVGRIPRRARLSQSRPHNQPDVAEEAAYEDAINSLFALGGPEVSRFVLIPVTGPSVDETVLQGFLSAFAASGRRACVLDLRPDAKHAADVRSLSDVLGHVSPEDHPVSSRRPPAVSIYAMTTRIPMSTLESEIPAAVVRLGLDFDIVMVVMPATASALIESTVETGAGVVLAVRHNSTSATDLVAIATRLRVMNVRPLGVLMTHAGPRAVGVAAESWRESDRNEIVSGEAPVADATAEAVEDVPAATATADDIPASAETSDDVPETQHVEDAPAAQDDDDAPVGEYEADDESTVVDADAVHTPDAPYPGGRESRGSD
ncbi:Wzz/FepE/Etk N-terminal domain-containing protein [Microbacterium sp. NPDC019599]|uniref:Wzz/FepE/Etk N-terminal domain-containing protein n=1 Tax=Microbacterium sp. NPDC019599 TaxID=3154690 RepID=UPI00340D1040